MFSPDTATIFRSLPGLFDVPPEHIVTVAGSSRLRCASPVAVDLLLLMDTGLFQKVTGTTLSRFGVSTPGFYQCASARTGESTNLYASEEESIYILRACKSRCVKFLVHKLLCCTFAAVLSTTALTPPVSINRPSTGSLRINLTCAAEGNPLPRLSWTMNNLPSSDGIQVVTGFMGTAYSILTLSTADLNLGPNTVLCTASLDPPVQLVDPVTRITTLTVQGMGFLYNLLVRTCLNNY